MRRIGLTGGIGSGKSTVANVFASRGAVVIDTDAIARELTGPGGAAMPALCDTFGTEVMAPDGSLDRARMRALAFGQPEVRHRLEGVLHPLIGDQARRRADLAGPEAIVVFDVPLLAESSSWRARCERIVVVDCSEATQVARVVKRSGWQEAQVQAVIAQQASRARRRAMADAVIHNDDISEARLHREVDSLWTLWIGTAI